MNVYDELQQMTDTLKRMKQRPLKSLHGYVMKYKGKSCRVLKDERKGTVRTLLLQSLDGRDEHRLSLTEEKIQSLRSSMKPEVAARYFGESAAKEEIASLEKAICEKEQFAKTRQEFVDYLKSLNVTHFVHFTPMKNLPSIASFGLVPVGMQERYGITSIRTDSKRMDGTQHNNLSITFPNYSMFFAKRSEMGIPFVVLKLDIELLLDSEISGNIVFCNHNAAATGVREGKQLEDLRQMFSARSYYKNQIISRDQLDIPDAFTTDPQAEVKIFGIIPPQYITDVLVESGDVISYAFVKKTPFASLVKENKEFFSYRKDYSFWKEGNQSGNTSGFRFCGYRSVLCS